MYEPSQGRRGGEHQPHPGSRQPDRWPDADWYPPERGQERRPVPHDIASERNRGRHQRQGDRPWHDPAPTVLDLNLKQHKAGRNWAQILGTVFFLIDTLVMADGFARPVATGSRVLVIFIWLISLTVVALLWLRGSSNFLKSAFLKSRFLRSLAVRNPASLCCAPSALLILGASASSRILTLSSSAGPRARLERGTYRLALSRTSRSCWHRG